jgi:Mn2+/Fe2+ NRAMP family transporter
LDGSHHLAVDGRDSNDGARIGMVTGMGLAAALRKKVPKPLVAVASLALFAANTINIGADLSGMGDATEMLTGISSHWRVAPFGILIGYCTVRFRYERIAQVLKWLALVLFAYVVTGFIVKPDWSLVSKATLIPSIPHGHEAWATLVAILGTTISPYLFFWQSSLEVEKDKEKGKKKLAERRGAPDADHRSKTGCRSRDVRFQHCHVFHHPDHSVDPE